MLYSDVQFSTSIRASEARRGSRPARPTAEPSAFLIDIFAPSGSPWRTRGGKRSALAVLHTVSHATLRGPRLVSAPRLICEYARNGHMSNDEARLLIDAISPHRSWKTSPYVDSLK